MLNEQAKHIAYLVKHAIDREIRVMEVSEEAEGAWVETIVSLARNGEEFLESCTPGYYNNEGKPGDEGGQRGTFFGRRQNAPYGGGPVAFVKLLEDWRADGTLPGMELR
jgi:cyclohexanone monooxygenase